MKANLLMLREAIEQVDSDPNKSLYFYNNPKARVKFLTDVIAFTVEQLDKLDNPISASFRINEINVFLDTHFQAYGWPAHEVHFHTNFLSHCACTFTCLNEISTIVEKLIKEKFAA